MNEIYIKSDQWEKCLDGKPEPCAWILGLAQQAEASRAKGELNRILRETNGVRRVCHAHQEINNRHQKRESSKDANILVRINKLPCVALASQLEDTLRVSFTETVYVSKKQR